MSDPVDFDDKRWEKATIDDIKPVDALRRAIKEIERGDIDVNHVIVIFHDKRNGKGGGVGWFQGGDFSWMSQCGMLQRALHIWNTRA